MLILLAIACNSCFQQPAKELDFSQKFEGDYDAGTSGIVYGQFEGVLWMNVEDGNVNGYMTNTSDGMIAFGENVDAGSYLTFDGNIYRDRIDEQCFEAKFKVNEYPGIKGTVWGCEGFDLIDLRVTGNIMEGNAPMKVVKPIDPYFQP